MLPWHIYQSYLSIRSRDSWRHKFDLWRHRGDTVSFMSTTHPKFSTEIHQNTTLYAKLNGEHAGEGFMPLRSIILEIRTRETKKSRIFRKFDLWPVALNCRFENLNWRFFWKRQGGSHKPSLSDRRWRNTVSGRGLVKYSWNKGGGLLTRHGRFASLYPKGTEYQSNYPQFPRWEHILNDSSNLTAAHK